ncbi:TonB-dependent receptor [Novosphingobium sp. JCM 18896]|uniref:TonB-dependent receptor n=1 Tax=Novosphingobium sp. JCM 18896 TaxID=2989731 RepID=UPI002222DEF6|nr:TonB-dependent receptor [Novosphingobium sp. JCM 18896]MCW1427698.1 carboxypeptidase regulatory-like domain-containing protein [Novosphingobium sp. JCM 18896]
MHFRHFLAATAASLTLAVALATPVAAQETTSSIRGTVMSEGSPVSGATVEIVNTATGARSAATSTASGGFDVSGLRAGDRYTVSVKAPGYVASQVTDVVTVVAQAFELPIELTAEGAGSNDMIVVTASRIQGAKSISQGPTTVLTAEQIQSVASINRDIRDLSRRDPFARLDDTPTGGRAISFAGQNPRYNRFSVDGVAITDSFGLNTDGLPSRRSPVPFDAIGQFQAKVAPYDVREGNFQGGSINIVLRSGTNDFQGTGFFAYSADELNGKSTKAGPGVPTGKVTLPDYTYKNFGAQISGPIIKDKLFFMIAGERLRASQPIPEGPIDNNAGTAIPTVTQALVDQISAIAKSRYGYDTGGVINTNGDKDDRLVAKLDWNISDTQRAAVTYTYAKDSIILGQNNFATPTYGLGLASNSYIQGNKLHTGVVQLNSDWSDNFSTEVRGFYKDYTRIQDPTLGRGFAQFQVCTAPTSDRTTAGAAATASINCAANFANISFGPDVSRQTNALRVKSYGGLLQGRLKAGDHDLKAFFEFQDVKTFNAFLQRSAGDYYFDSIADFQAGTAQRFRYGNAIPTLDPNDAAASFRYQGYTVGIQDNWRVSDLLTVNAGARLDFYGGSSHAALNQTFLTRYGFANNEFINGMSVFQPRFGFTWKPLSEVTIRGGAGVFAGGTPDVYVSNSFSNTGVLTNAIDVQQANNGTYSGSGANATTGAAILTNVNGTTIPTAANGLLTNASVSANSPTNALAKDFKLPSQWRLTMSADWEPEQLGFLGRGWSFGADILYSKVRQQVYFTDARVVANGLTTPDGRPRYNAITAFTDTNSDIILTNSSKGRSIVGILRARKNWEFGLDAGVSYTYQDIKDANPATSSTAGSNYAAGVSLDPNGPAYGISNDEVRNAFKFDVNFNHAFFGDYKTTLGIFGESRSGHTYSYTFRDLGTRSTVFGTIGSGTRYLLYVPTGINDPKVSFANATDATLFDQFIDASGLGKYRGTIAPRNAFRSNWVTKVDLHFAQELPTGIGKARFTLFADIENFTNLLNKNWGQIREYPFAYTISPVQVQCLTTPVATGTAPGAAVASTSSAPCAQYRYTANQTSNGQFTAPTDTIYARQSLYTIRVGARISF